MIDRGRNGQRLVALGTALKGLDAPQLDKGRMMDKIFDGLDYARRDKCQTVLARIKKIAARNGTKFVNEKFNGKPVFAEVNAGRWIALCPDCAGAEAVSPSEPIFYCFSCGNEKTGGKYREVIFPENYVAIEMAMLERPVITQAGRDEISKAILAKAENFPRYWKPGTSLRKLQAENKEVKHG